jgi:hypothetical protein
MATQSQHDRPLGADWTTLESQSILIQRPFVVGSHAEIVLTECLSIIPCSVLLGRECIGQPKFNTVQQERSSRAYDSFGMQDSQI